MWWAGDFKPNTSSAQPCQGAWWPCSNTISQEGFLLRSLEPDLDVSGSESFVCGSLRLTEPRFLNCFKNENNSNWIAPEQTDQIEPAHASCCLLLVDGPGSSHTRQPWNPQLLIGSELLCLHAEGRDCCLWGPGDVKGCFGATLWWMALIQWVLTFRDVKNTTWNVLKTVQ